MKTFFEYFYYRIAKLNFKGNKPERAIISVTMTQFMVMLNILMGIYLLIFPDIRRKFNIYESIFIIILFFVIDFYNGKLYKGRYQEFEERWGQETRQKKIKKMFVIVLTIVVAFCLVFVNAWIFDRFKKY